MYPSHRQLPLENLAPLLPPTPHRQALNRPSVPVAYKILQSGLACLFCLLIAACDEQAAETGCEYVSDNLLTDTGFTTLDAPRALRQWQSSEHAAGESFVYGAKDGVLSIEQKGIEPWIIISQRLGTNALAGKVVEFSAQLKMDLVPPERSHDFKLGGGLVLSAGKNGKVLVDSTLEHEPHMGVHDWQTARVVVALPRNTGYLKTAFLHQAGGVLQVRKPSLRQVKKECLFISTDN